MELFSGLMGGFAVAVSPINLLFCLIGAFLGTAIGVLPGLGPAATISILLPLSYALGDPTTSIIMMAGIYYGAMYGGSTTSILLSLPGEAASVVTCIDGYQMAKKGRAGAALGIAAIGSFVAGTVGVIALTFIAPPLAKLALQFGPAEYFSLTILGLMMAAFLSGKSAIKGMLMVVLGLLLATVGMDPVHGAQRYTFDTMLLMDGLDFLTLAMGMFGIGEILCSMEEKISNELVTSKINRIWPTVADFIRTRWSILRGSIIGFTVGLLPGGGAVIASLLAYSIEKRVSKHPEEFGEGAIEGVAAPESANNAAASASFIPMMTLGIPGNPAIAMIYAALLIQGVQAGPMLLVEHADVFWGVVASMYIGNILLLILNLPLIGLWIKMLKIPYSILAPIIVVISSIGVYTDTYNVMDIMVMYIMGVLGYLLRKLNFDLGPLILAFVLGRILERSLSQALIISSGSPAIFIQKPISAAFLLVILCIIVFSVIGASRKVKTVQTEKP